MLFLALNYQQMVLPANVGGLAIVGVEGSGIYHDAIETKGDGIVRIFDVRSKLGTSSVLTCSTPMDEHCDIQLSPCGYYFAVCGSTGPASKGVKGDVTFVFDLRKVSQPYSKLMADFAPSSNISNGTQAVLWTQSGSLLTGDADGCVRMWNVHRNEITKTIAGHDGAINRLSFSHGKNYLN